MAALSIAILAREAGLGSLNPTGDAGAGKRRARVASPEGGRGRALASSGVPAAGLSFPEAIQPAVAGARKAPAWLFAPSTAFLAQKTAQDSGANKDVEPWIAADAYGRLDRPADVKLDLIAAV